MVLACRSARLFVMPQCGQAVLPGMLHKGRRPLQLYKEPRQVESSNIADPVPSAQRGGLQPETIFWQHWFQLQPRALLGQTHQLESQL